MDKIKCLIVDDEPIAQRILEGYLTDLNEFALVDKCLHALAAREVLLKEKIDLMFLDLEMPKLKGLAFLKTIENPPEVIITTAHREFALESYEFQALDYLLKPISFERFLKAVNRYKKGKYLSNNRNLPLSQVPSYLYVTSERKTLKLLQSDILYIEGMNNYIKIYIDGKKHIVYASLQDILKKLGNTFVRTHKSYIINKNKISAFTKEYIEIEGKQIPIGNAYRRIIQTF